MPTKRIVCLANSRKLNERCIAGLEFIAGKPPAWIRPVGAREHQEVAVRERRYSNGGEPRLLDIIDVPLVRHLPRDYQTENWLLDYRFYWKKVGVCSWSDLKKVAESTGPLWVNEISTYNGTNDQVPLSQLTTETRSLKLIHVGKVRLRVFTPGTKFGDSRRRVQASFQFVGVDYALWVTDPCIEQALLRKDDGIYHLEECLLTISLGEPFKEHAQKLVAAIVVKS